MAISSTNLVCSSIFTRLLIGTFFNRLYKFNNVVDSFISKPSGLFAQSLNLAVGKYVFNRELRNINKNRIEMKNAITEMNNTLKGFNSKLNNTAGWINGLEYREVKITEA